MFLCDYEEGAEDCTDAFTIITDVIRKERTCSAALHTRATTGPL